jgi:uncharacterized SAM-binding protein YcdF (DUF218 family)
VSKSRILAATGLLVALTMLAHVPLLRGVGSFLIVEDPLEKAAAIVSLGGQPPFREMEAARLYRDGWAPTVVIVRGLRPEEERALRAMGVAVPEGWEVSREVLLRHGVPSSAILIPEDEAEGTLEELRAVAEAVQPGDAPVVLVSSKYHTRRARLTWQYVTGGRSRAIVRPAAADPFDPARWWRERRFVLSVVREYLGLVNYYAGFPVAP